MNKMISMEQILVATRVEAVKSVLFGFKGRRPEGMSEEEYEKLVEQTKSQVMVFVGNPDIEPIHEDELFKLAEELRSQASWQESAAILNPNYPLSKNNVIREQVKSEMDTKDAVAAMFL